VRVVLVIGGIGPVTAGEERDRLRQGAGVCGGLGGEESRVCEVLIVVDQPGGEQGGPSSEMLGAIAGNVPDGVQGRMSDPERLY
jgi:hypothetical protein